MIKEIIINEQKEILKRINEYEKAKNEYERLKEREKELKEKIEKTNKQNTKFPTPIIEQKFNIFQRIFSRKYREHIKAKEEYEVKLKAAKEENEKIDQQRIELKRDMEDVRLNIAKQESIMNKIDIAELRQRFLDLKDSDEKAINVILKINPELAKNVEFMREAITININNIQYDCTNDLNMYLKVLEEFKKDMYAKEKFENFSDKNFEQCIDRIKKELIEPKEVDEDKYKIPIKYFYEAIRRTILSDRDGFLFSQVQNYYYNDGIIPKETGEKIQQLYEDKENYLLKHDIFWENRVENIARTICLEGLKCCQHDEHALNNLKRTTVGSYQKGTWFLDFLRETKDNTIFISIPKKVLDENGHIWGSDYKQITTKKGEAAYILPKYVVGFRKGDNNIFVENPIPTQERRKYKYKFRSNEIEASVEEKEPAEG